MDPLSDLERLVLDDDSVISSTTEEAPGVASPVSATEQGDATTDADSGGEGQSTEADGATGEATPEAEADETAEAPKAETAELTEAELAQLGERAQKRIHQLTRQAREAQEALEAERATRLAERAAKDQSPDKGKDTPLLAVPNRLTDVLAQKSPYAEQIERLESLAELADKHPEGVELADGKGGMKFFAPEQLREAQRTAQRELRALTAQDAVWREHKKHEFATEEQRHIALAEQRFGFVKDTTTPEHQMARQILQQMPEIRRFPNWPVALAIVAKGLVDFEREQAAPAAAAGGTPTVNGADKTKPGPTVAAPTSGAVRRAPVAPKVGTGSAAGAPRSTAGAAGQRARGLTAAIQAAARGDREGELTALEAIL